MISEISGSAGLRLLIHNQYNMPFVEDEGLALSTGQSSVVGIKKVCLLILASENALNNVIKENVNFYIRNSGVYKHF